VPVQNNFYLPKLDPKFHQLVTMQNANADQTNAYFALLISEYDKEVSYYRKELEKANGKISEMRGFIDPIIDDIDEEEITQQYNKIIL